MRTKALLVAAAVTAAGIATSLAQSNVYSVNVVGYVNTPLVTGFQLVGNPLNNSAGNNVNTLFGTSLPANSTIYAFVGGTYITSTYTSKGGWGGDTNSVNTALALGKGVFLKVPSAATVTFVGDVAQGALSTPVAAGFNIVSSQVPQAGLIQTDLGYVPAANDTVYQFVPATQNYDKVSTYTTKGGWGGTGQPNLGVAEAVWLKSSAGGTWSRNFTVQ